VFSVRVASITRLTIVLEVEQRCIDITRSTAASATVASYVAARRWWATLDLNQ